MNGRPLVLVSGASGYIASRLIPLLLERAYGVRALVRDPLRLQGRPWTSEVEVAVGDVTCPDELLSALQGVHTAYYLVHSMAHGRDQARWEVEGARAFAHAAEQAGLQHIIYLGGLVNVDEPHLAPHMRARLATGETLRRAATPVTEFRASVILGAGSKSFEMIRFTTELFPILVGPTWLKNEAQPIALQNVLDYLIGALERPATEHRIFEIGGAEVTTYGDLILQYAFLRGLRRTLLLLPGLPLGLVASIAGRVTPVPAPVARVLIEALRNASVVHDDSARRVFPAVQLLSSLQAIQDALQQLNPRHLDRIWGTRDDHPICLKHEGFLVDARGAAVRASPARAYRVLRQVGGGGWLCPRWVWSACRLMDRLLGGGPPPFPSEADRERGSPLEGHRLEVVEPPRLLRVHSELTSAGQAWMEWRLEAHPRGARLSQTVFFAPRGLPGFLFWRLLRLFHALLFRRLLRAISRSGET